MISRRNNLIYLLVIWLFIGVIPASLTTATPHALRILPTLPIFIVCITLGIYQITLWFSQHLNQLLKIIKLSDQRFIPFLIGMCFITFYGWQFIGYWRFYSIVYPVEYASEWQYGYKEMVEKVIQVQSEQPELPVQITREYGRPAIYYWFYAQIEPTKVQANENHSIKDQGETLSFEQVKFVDRVEVTEKTLVASSLKSYEEFLLKKRTSQVLSKIDNPDGKTVWVIYLSE